MCFTTPVTTAELEKVKELLKAVKEVKQGCGYSWDGVCLAVGMSNNIAGGEVKMESADYEDLCQDYGFEYIDFEVRSVSISSNSNWR